MITLGLGTPRLRHGDALGTHWKALGLASGMLWECPGDAQGIPSAA